MSFYMRSVIKLDNEKALHDKKFEFNFYICGRVKCV